MKLSTLVPAASLCALAAASAPASVAAQAGTGVIEGTVTLQEAPRRRTANRYPGGRADTHRIQNLPAVAYLVGPVPAGAHGPSTSSPRMTQRDTTFVPSVVTVPVGGTVAFPNQDPFQHNVFSYSPAKTFDLGRQNPGTEETVTFDEAGIVEVFCEVHDFMRGAIIVTENPFVAIAGAGSFRLDGVPPGEYTLAVWHPDHRRFEQSVTVRAGETTRVEVGLQR